MLPNLHGSVLCEYLYHLNPFSLSHSNRILVFSSSLQMFYIYYHSKRTTTEVDLSKIFRMPSSTATSVFSVSIRTKSNISYPNKSSTLLTRTSYLSILPSSLMNVVPPVFVSSIHRASVPSLSPAPNLYAFEICDNPLRWRFLTSILQLALQGQNTVSFPPSPTILPMSTASIPVCDPIFITFCLGETKAAIRVSREVSHEPVSRMDLETTWSVPSTIMEKL